jgi:hypothetical protein
VSQGPTQSCTSITSLDQSPIKEKITIDTLQSLRHPSNSTTFAFFFQIFRKMIAKLEQSFLSSLNEFNLHSVFERKKKKKFFI